MKNFTEDSAPGSEFLAQLTRDWEAESSRAKGFGARVVIPRFGIVLAKGGALPRMLLPFKLGAGGRIGSGKQWMSWIALRDIVGILVYALETSCRAARPTPYRRIRCVTPNSRKISATCCIVLTLFPARFCFAPGARRNGRCTSASSQRVLPKTGTAGLRVPIFPSGIRTGSNLLELKISPPAIRRDRYRSRAVYCSNRSTAAARTVSYYLFQRVIASISGARSNCNRAIHTMAFDINNKQLDRAKRFLENKVDEAIQTYQSILLEIPFNSTPCNRSATSTRGWDSRIKPRRITRLFSIAFSKPAKRIAQALYTRALRIVRQPPERMARYALLLQRQNRTEESIEQYSLPRTFPGTRQGRARPRMHRAGGPTRSGKCRASMRRG